MRGAAAAAPACTDVYGAAVRGRGGGGGLSICSVARSVQIETSTKKQAGEHRRRRRAERVAEAGGLEAAAPGTGVPDGKVGKDGAAARSAARGEERTAGAEEQEARAVASSQVGERGMREAVRAAQTEACRASRAGSPGAAQDCSRGAKG